MPRRLTAEDLRRMAACASHADLFVRAFPAGEATLDEATLLRAARAGLDLEWLARALPVEAEARAALDAVVEAARAAYIDLSAEARHEYERAAVRGGPFETEARATLARALQPLKVRFHEQVGRAIAALPE